MAAVDARLDDGVVRLSPAGEADRDHVEAGIHDPEVVRWFGPPSGTVDEVLETNRRRAADGSPTFAIRDRAGSFLGLAWVNRRSAEPATGSIGYWLLPEARGHGHATRAVRLLVDHAVRALGVRRVILLTDVANEASRRVAERAGFQHTATRPGAAELDGRSSDVAVYTFPLGER